jgi:hypothetical protein
MQHIGLRLEDENGKLIEQSDINFVDIVNVFSDNQETYPWLYGIDPYGITVFNLYQIPYVIVELKQLSSEVEDVGLKTVINKAIDFISKTEQHTYTKLIGD